VGGWRTEVGEGGSGGEEGSVEGGEWKKGKGEEERRRRRRRKRWTKKSERERPQRWRGSREDRVRRPEWGEGSLLCDHPAGCCGRRVCPSTWSR